MIARGSMCTSGQMAPLLFCQVRHRHSVNIKAGKVEHKKMEAFLDGR